MAPLISLLPRVVLDNISPWIPFYVPDQGCKGGGGKTLVISNFGKVKELRNNQSFHSTKELLKVKSSQVTDLFLNPRRAQCTALAQAEAGAMAAAGTARTAAAKAGPAPEPR